MPVIKIAFESGETQTRELIKTAPISIGRHATNDVRIDRDGVAVMHCRISWNKTGYEVVAATHDGIEVNGTLVRNQLLAHGDVVQIGGVLLTYEEVDEARAHGGTSDARGAGDLYELKPISEDEIPVQFAHSSWRPRKVQPPPLPPTVKAETAPSPPKSAKSSKRTATPASAAAAATEEAPLAEPLEEPLDEDYFEEIEPAASASRPRGEKPAGQRLWSRGTPRRPGEQDVLRSPLVLGLGGGALALLLAAFTLYFIIGRETSSRRYEQALASLEQRNYSQAIREFEAFLAEYPRHDYAPAAQKALGFARVELPLSSTPPAWERALEALQTFVRQNRDQPDYSEFRPRVLRLAGRIATGAAESAAARKNKPLLATAVEARRVLEIQRANPEDAEDTLKTADAAIARAEAVLHREDELAAGLTAIDAALSARQPFEALKERRRLLHRYPDAASLASLNERLTRILAVEQELIRLETPERKEAITAEADGLPAPLTLIRRTRARSDGRSEGTNVFVIAGDCCYGVDTVLGEPRWRRVIGSGSKFPPTPVQTDKLALLLFDSRRDELILVRQSDGGLLWRQPLAGRPLGTPLLHDGQAFIATTAGHLHQIDLQSGVLHARIELSQPLAGPPVLIGDGQHMAIAGHQEVIYTLTHRPLACIGVSHTGHAAGSVVAPLLKMGGFILLAENDRETSCRLSLWDAASDPAHLAFVTSQRVSGHVLDRPVLRGKQLYVPSTVERISAYTIADLRDDGAMTPVATYEVARPVGGPLHVTAGPDDELWMTSSMLRKFKLGAERFEMIGPALPLGVCTQPPQVVGRELFVSRQLPCSRAVSLISVDRERMVGQWQVVAGGCILALSGGSDGNPLCAVTEAGDVFTITPGDVQSGGFVTKPVQTLELPDQLAEPLQATRLHDGRLAAFTAGDSPRLWIIGPTGQVQIDRPLSEPLQADPIALGGGILLPLPGRLRLLREADAGPAVEDYLAPVDPERMPRWRSVLRLEENQALAVTAEGRISRIQLNREPVPHLFEVAHVDTGAAIEQAPVVIGEQLFVVAGLRLLQLDVRTLETKHEVAIDAPASQPLRSVADKLFVMTGREHLSCFDPADQLQLLWRLPLEGASLAGAPFAWNDRLLVALQDGEILVLEPGSGEIVQRIDAQQSLAGGFYRLDETIVVLTRDGSLQPLTSLRELQE